MKNFLILSILLTTAATFSATFTPFPTISPPTNTLTAKGDLLGHNGTSDVVLPGGTDGYVLVRDDAEASGLNWIQFPISTTLTTKGDIQTFDTANARLPVGLDGEFLVADSAEATGLKWSDTISGTLNPVTDWASFTPTFTNLTLGTGGSTECKQRRVGDTQSINCKVALGTGGAFTGTLYLDLPQTADSSKLVRSTFDRPFLGTVKSYDATSTVDTLGEVIFDTGSLTRVYFTSDGLPSWSATTPFTWGANDELFIHFTYPVQNWSSGVDAAITQTTIEEYNSTEWTNVASPTYSWSGTSSSDNMQWRRVGDSMEITFYTVLNGAPTGFFDFTLPNGHTIDFSKTSYVTSGGGLNVFGNATFRDSSTSTNSKSGFVYASASNKLGIIFDDNIAATSATHPIVWATNDNIKFRATVPITGWTDTTTKPAVVTGVFDQINSTDLIKVVARSNSVTSITNSFPRITLNNEVLDTHNAFSSSLFTSPRDTCYAVSGHVAYDTGSSSDMLSYIVAGGQGFRGNRGQSASLWGSTAAVDTVCITTGQTIELQAYAFPTRNSEALYSYLTITELPDYEAIVKNLYDNTTKCQKKYLSTNVSTNTTIPDLSFSNLTVGKRYKIIMNLRLLTGGDQFDFSYSNLTGGIMSIPSEAGSPSYSSTHMFIATNSTITAQTSGIATAIIYGGVNQTWAYLCQLPDSYVETTEW